MNESSSEILRAHRLRTESLKLVRQMLNAMFKLKEAHKTLEETHKQTKLILKNQIRDKKI